MESTEVSVTKEFLTFIEEQIEKFQTYTRLHEELLLTPEMINTAMASYESVNIMLIGLYRKNKTEEYNVQKQYKKWFDKKFSEIRKEMIAEADNKSVKIAIKEYESELRVRFEDEYWAWQDKMTVAENKTGFALDLLQSWKSYDKILVQLSSNMRGEMYALSLDNRINFTQDKVRVLPRRGQKLEG